MTDVEDTSARSRPSKQRSVVDVLHISAFVLIGITGLRLISSAVPVVTDAYGHYGNFGLSVDFWQRLIISLPRFDTLLPALFGVLCLALLRHLGESSKTPGFFVALGVAGVSGVVMTLSTLYGFVRMLTNSVDTRLFFDDMANKIAYYSEWTAIAAMGSLVAYLAWFLWSDDSDLATIDDTADPDDDTDDEGVDEQDGQQGSTT